MKNLIVNRHEWHNRSNSFLFSKNPKTGKPQYCIMGFLGKSLGINPQKMKDICIPLFCDSEIYNLFPLEQLEAKSSWQLGTYVCPWSAVFASMNDCNIDSETKEAWLTEGFKTILSINLEFS